MYEDLPKDEILKLISEYKLFKSLCEASLRNSPYHTFRKDLQRSISHCDKNLILLHNVINSKSGEK